MSAVKQLRYIILLSFIFSFNFIKAQKTPYLERLVTLTANKQTVAELLKTISDQTSVVFSYSQSFNDKQQLSLVCKNKPLRLVILELLKPLNCSYKIKDKYIIITYDNKPTEVNSKIEGYVYSVYDSLIIRQASIYIKQDKHSAVTNNFGFFELTFPNKSENITISVAKENYCDTSISLYNKSKQEVIIYLYPKDKSKPLDINVISNVPIENTEPIRVNTFINISNTSESRLTKFKTNFKNISDTLFSNFSLSFLPFISTNRLLSVNTVNKYSLNILAGYSKGIDVIEIGGLLNIDNGDVKYVQIGGLGNRVFGNVFGVQIAGLTNINSKRTQGLQIAGLINHSDRVKGVQIAGLVNINQKKTEGVQIAGILNKTNTLNGFQMAGLINYSDSVSGMQIAGLINKTKVLKGAQLSILNFADSSAGIPIGFFSYVKKGYHKVEIATDEMRFGTFSFGTGVNKLHNVFSVGINYSNPQLWTYGYGLGSSYSVHRKWNLCLNLSAQQVQLISNKDLSVNIISKLNLSAEYKLGSKLVVGLGPNLSIFNTEFSNVNYSLYSSIAPYSFYNQTNSTTNTKMWVGAKLYLKIM